MRFTSCAALVLAMVVASLAPAFAHDGSFGSPTEPIELSTFDGQNFIHENEQFPWKGNAFIYVKNTSAVAWGDFHFKIISWNGDNISNVDFKDASMGGVDPISTQSPLSWTINNTVVGAELSLYFYSDPVYPGQVATFQIYTDNTTDNVQFGLCMFPSQVPEPSTLAGLAGGFVGLFGLALRRRR